MFKMLFFSFFCISCVKGKLVEVNEELVSNPNIMLEKVMPSTGKRLNVLLTALVTSLKNIGSLITCRVQDVLTDESAEDLIFGP